MTILTVQLISDPLTCTPLALIAWAQRCAIKTSVECIRCTTQPRSSNDHALQNKSVPYFTSGWQQNNTKLLCCTAPCTKCIYIIWYNSEYNDRTSARAAVVWGVDAGGDMHLTKRLLHWVNSNPVKCCLLATPPDVLHTALYTHGWQVVPHPYQQVAAHPQIPAGASLQDWDQVSFMIVCLLAFRVCLFTPWTYILPIFIVILIIKGLTLFLFPLLSAGVGYGSFYERFTQPIYSL